MKDEFHVGAGPLTGTIYAGKITKLGNWRVRSDVTSEAVKAVADHMVTQKIEQYSYKYKDRIVRLKCEVEEYERKD